MKVQDKEFGVYAVGKDAIAGSTEITLKRIVEKEKTRRLLILIAAVLVVFAASIMVFGPQERQAVTTLIGVIVLVFALGAIGASQFVIKAAGIEVSSGGDRAAAPDAIITDSNETREMESGHSSQV